MKEPNPDPVKRTYLNLGAIDPELRARLERFAASRGLVLTSAARFLISEGLDRHEKS
jgi:hypothetical protein